MQHNNHEHEEHRHGYRGYEREQPDYGREQPNRNWGRQDRERERQGPGGYGYGQERQGRGREQGAWREHEDYGGYGGYRGGQGGEYEGSYRRQGDYERMGQRYGGREHGGYRDEDEEAYRRQGDYERMGQGYGGREYGSYGGYGGERQGFQRGQFGDFGRMSRGGGFDQGGHDSYGGYQGFSQEHQGQYFGRGPKGYQRSDERIHEEVCEALTYHPDIDASEIEVMVNTGQVTLKGTVENRQMKRMAEECVESISGVKDVENQLRVSYQQQSGSHPQMEQRGQSGQSPASLSGRQTA